MNCDPPTIACSECVTTGAVAPIGTVDFLWDNQCDRCGAYETLLTPTLFRLRHMTISRTCCRRCADEDQDHASKRTERTCSSTGNRDTNEAHSKVKRKKQ